MEGISEELLAAIQSLSAENRAALTAHLNSKSTKPDAGLELPGRFTTFDVSGIWPKRKEPLELLWDVPFCMTEKFTTRSGLLFAIRCLLGVLSSSTDTPNVFGADLVLRIGPEPDSREVNDEENLGDLVPSNSESCTFYVHCGETIPFPASNDWKATAGKRALSDREQGRMQGLSGDHCVITGAYAVSGERAHECAHIIPAATASKAFNLFCKAATKEDPYFPDLASTDAESNILFIDLIFHRGLDGETVGICAPTTCTTQRASNGEDVRVIEVPKDGFEFHHVNTGQRSKHKTPLRDLVGRLNVMLKEPSTAATSTARHLCGDSPRFLRWYNWAEPTDSLPQPAAEGDGPHPFLLQAHYGVFLAQNWASCALRQIVLGDEEEDGGNESDTEEEDWETEEEVHKADRIDWFHFILDQVIKRKELVYLRDS
ncbi:hypothetical protein B0H19DRAFT_1099635 [Mycena capillaripes]|nr:hypothetical protein B0H19DRAFT_1099635 [Mycena capillaripes]